MIAHWTHFAQTGDPNAPDLATWPPLSASTNVRLNFALESTLLHDFRTAECDFWRRRFDAAFSSTPP
jgi:carboxylesterase type B